MGKYTIKVIDARDRAVVGVLVYVNYGFWSGQSCGYTDKDGQVTLDNTDDKFRPGYLTINHEDIGKIPAQVGESYTVRV